jgi:hypothetical protein
LPVFLGAERVLQHGGGDPETSTAPLLLLLGFGLRRAKLMLHWRTARRVR